MVAPHPTVVTAVTLAGVLLDSAPCGHVVDEFRRALGDVAQASELLPYLIYLDSDDRGAIVQAMRRAALRLLTLAAEIEGGCHGRCDA